ANELGNNLTVFFQGSPGRFRRTPFTLGGPGATDAPVSVAAADLDGDGDQDLVSANRIPSNNLTFFLQLSPGTFSPDPLTLGDLGTTREPRAVAGADLDGDGDLDLVSANQTGNNLTVFFQLPGGTFAAPLTLGGFATTSGPHAVAAADLDGDGDLDLV